MWWTPRDRQEVAVAEVVTRLVRGFQAHLGEVGAGVPVVWGVGTTFDQAGRPVPLVLTSIEALGDHAPIRLDDARRDQAELPEQIEAVLARWDAPPETVVRPTFRPMAAGTVRSGGLVQDAQTAARRATVGLPCALKADPRAGAFITAGHLVDAVGDRVRVLGRGPAGPFWLGGTVRLRCDPIDSAPNAEYDYAVIELDAGKQVATIAHTGVQAAPIAAVIPMSVSVTGAVSGVRPLLTVNGALNQLGDSTRQWKNCWSLAPSYSLQLGDSGSLALGVTPGPSAGRVFGHFVGGSYWPDHPHPGLVHLFVQDLRSCLAYGLGNHIVI
jgi:hypothetical protein